MVAETAAAAEVLFQQSVSVQFQICVSQPTTMELADPSSILSISPSIFSTSESFLPFEDSRSESAFSCSTSIQAISTPDTRSSKFFPIIRSGSRTDIGPRRYNEDEHIQIDDVSAHLGSLHRWPLPSSFYAVFDGHGGADAATYMKNNAVKFFLKDAALPRKSDVNEIFLAELEYSQRQAFLQADQALADERSVDASCGTTALTALVIGRNLLIANAGDCRAVLCRKGVAVQMSQDHRPSCPLEQRRIENAGGFIEYGYLNGELSVTRALGDLYMKQPVGSASPLIAEPEVQQVLLTEDDEFLILGCDGIWDVMSNQEAVSLVRRKLRQHDDPGLCARELVSQALRRDTCDNVTVIIVCFTSLNRQDLPSAQRRRLRCCSLSEDARRKLQTLLEGN